MARVLVLYNQPADKAAFDAYYHQKHIPLAKTLPGLRGMTLSAGAPVAIAGTAPYLVAELTFDSLADVQAALSSPEGQATAADVANYAHSGATILIVDMQSAM